MLCRRSRERGSSFGSSARPKTLGAAKANWCGCGPDGAGACAKAYGCQRRLGANSWSVPDACERAKDSRFRVTWRKVRMSSFTAHILVSTLRSRLLAGGVVAGFLAITLIPSFSAVAPAEDSVPQLGSRDFGWNANFWDFQLDPPPGSA